VGGTLWITFSTNQNLALTASYIYKRALHRAQPFSAAHHHNLFISWNSEFSQFSTTSPSACLWTILLFLFVVGGGSTHSPLLKTCCLLYIRQLLRLKFVTFGGQTLCQTMLTLSLLTKPFSKLVRRHAVLVYSFDFFSTLATRFYKTLCYKNGQIVISIVWTQKVIVTQQLLSFVICGLRFINCYIML